MDDAVGLLRRAGINAQQVVEFAPAGPFAGVVCGHEPGSREWRSTADALRHVWRRQQDTPPILTHVSEGPGDGCGWVLALGTSWGWQDSAPAGAIHGRWGVWKSEVMVMQTGDPLIIPRGQMGLWNQHVNDFFYNAVRSRGVSLLAQTCVKCHTGTYTYTPDGMAWCRRHLPTIDKSTKDVGVQGVLAD